MRILLFLITLFVFQKVAGQQQYNKPYFSTNIATTLAINEDYTLDPDDDEALIEPASILLNIGIGYQLHRRWQISANTGYHHHLRYNINAIPLYGSLRYNIIEKEDDNFFIEYSQGKMWRPSPKFENGKYYSLGLGTQITGATRWATTVRIDFIRKSVLNFKNGYLDSIALGIGFTFL